MSHYRASVICLVGGLLVVAFYVMQRDHLRATGFFHTQFARGRWVLVEPAGKPYFSIGLSYIAYQGYTIQGSQQSPYTMAISIKYGSRNRWTEAMATNMMGWGFNTLGAWSDNDLASENVSGKHLAYTPLLDLGAGFVEQTGGAAWLQGIFPDVFDPRFEAYCRAETQKRCRMLKDDPRLLGWFIDNELRWGPDLRASEELLVSFLNQSPRRPGRDAALRFLRERYPDVKRLNEAWGTSFPSWQDAARAQKFTGLPGADRGTPDKNAASIADCNAFSGLVAETYFRVTSSAIKFVDPNHLILGCRFANVPPPPVLEAARKYLDVISFNCYETDPTEKLKIYAAQGKPILISEFSFRGKDAACPNTKGAGPLVASQQDRANGFEAYVRAALTNSNLVGYQWFDLADEPKEGRFDGENSNNGVVDINDQPYPLLVGKMAEVNGQAWRMFQKSRGD